MDIFNWNYDVEWEEAGRRVDELFGDQDYPPDNEMAIINDDNLNHAEKVATLRALRAGKQIKPRRFAKRMTRAGRISAHGMGIRLD